MRALLHDAVDRRDDGKGISWKGDIEVSGTPDHWLERGFSWPDR